MGDAIYYTIEKTVRVETFSTYVYEFVWIPVKLFTQLETLTIGNTYLDNIWFAYCRSIRIFYFSTLKADDYLDTRFSA